MDNDRHTVTELIEMIAGVMCDQYCKYPEQWDYEKNGELCESDVCKNCPLLRLC